MKVALALHNRAGSREGTLVCNGFLQGASKRTVHKSALPGLFSFISARTVLKCLARALTYRYKNWPGVHGGLGVDLLFLCITGRGSIQHFPSQSGNCWGLRKDSLKCASAPKSSLEAAYQPLGGFAKHMSCLPIRSFGDGLDLVLTPPSAPLVSVHWPMA